jgi:hypothetical protein
MALTSWIRDLTHDLLEDLLEVIFDGIWADEELGADLSAGKPVGNEPGDLEFSYREIGG